MHVSEIIDLIREYVDEPEDDGDTGDYPDTSLIQFINAEHRHVFSIVRQAYEAWFTRPYIYPLTTSQYLYHLPRGMVGLQRVEIIDSGVSEVTDDSVSPEFTYYSVDEENKQACEIEPMNLNQIDSGYRGANSGSHRGIEGYTLLDREIRFSTGTPIVTGKYLRIFYTPSAPDLHRALVQDAGDNFLSLGNNGLTTTLGRVRKVSDYYVGCDVEIVSGNGVGEIKKIIRHDPITGTIWTDSDWVTTPDVASVYSINSPILEDYHEILALGAALRSKGIKTEDDATLVAEMYGSLIEDLKKTMETRVEQGSRRVVNSGRYGSWN